MKIRNGFVSNSSSSSFIVVIAVASKNPELDAMIANGDISVVSVDDILDNGEYPTDCSLSFDEDGSARVYNSMTYTELTLTEKDRGKYLIDRYISAESFEENDWGEIYDVVYSDSDEELINFITNNAERYDQGEFTGRDG